MDWDGKGDREMAEEGAAWMLLAVSNLIDRHRVAHKRGIQTWPKEWEAWAHYRKGSREYQRSRRH